MATAPKTHKPLHSGFVRIEHDKRRGSAVERGYDWTWHKLRESYVKQHPLCEDCEQDGLTVPVDEVDHIIPINGPNDPLLLDPQNLRSRCKACHVKKTRMDGRIRGMFDDLRKQGMQYDDARSIIVEKVERERIGWGVQSSG